MLPLKLKPLRLPLSTILKHCVTLWGKVLCLIFLNFYYLYNTVSKQKSNSWPSSARQAKFNTSSNILYFQNLLTTCVWANMNKTLHFTLYITRDAIFYAKGSWISSQGKVVEANILTSYRRRVDFENFKKGQEMKRFIWKIGEKKPIFSHYVDKWKIALFNTVNS